MSDNQSSPSTKSTLSLSPPSTSNHASSSSHPYRVHPSRPAPPPPSDRRPPTKNRSKQFKLLRKTKEFHISLADEDEDWTLEGTTTNGHARRSPESSRRPLADANPVADPQGTGLTVPRDENGRKKSRTRVLVKKTSKMFTKIDKDKLDDASSSGAISPDSLTSLHAPSGSRQPSYSSVASSETNGTGSRHHFSALNRPLSNSSSTQYPYSSHTRRLSHDSASSLQARIPPPRSDSASSPESSFDSRQHPIPQRQSSHLGKSLPPDLSRQSLPQPPLPPINATRTGDTFPTRMSTWFSQLLPSSSSTTITQSTNPPNGESLGFPPSPLRKPPSATASFLNAARQRAVDGVRHLLDSEAHPDTCADDMWVLGVAHPGWRPSTPVSVKDVQLRKLERSQELQEPKLNSPSRQSSPPNGDGGQQPTVWAKRKDLLPSTTTSQQAKGFTNIFSTSTPSLALPNGLSAGSPSKEGTPRGRSTESPSKAKKVKPEKESIEWPDQCRWRHTGVSFNILQSMMTSGQESGVHIALNMRLSILYLTDSLSPEPRPIMLPSDWPMIYPPPPKRRPHLPLLP